MHGQGGGGGTAEIGLNPPRLQTLLHAGFETENHCQKTGVCLSESVVRYAAGWLTGHFPARFSPQILDDGQPRASQEVGRPERVVRAEDVRRHEGDPVPKGQLYEAHPILEEQHLLPEFSQDLSAHQDGRKITRSTRKNTGRARGGRRTGKKEQTLLCSVSTPPLSLSRVACAEARVSTPTSTSTREKKHGSMYDPRSIALGWVFTVKYLVNSANSGRGGGAKRL